MDITPFYELRYRLFCTAAAGCAAIQEDFRLKRAVEAFQPLSSANKVFGKFYAMCQSLFTAENCASALAECIALADALAVTQGVYTDSAPTKFAAGHIRKQTYLPVSHLMLQDLLNKITAKSPQLMHLSPQEIGMLSDPRVLSAFLDLSDMKNANLDAFTETMIAVYGTDLVPLFQRRLNSDNPKSNGKQVEWVSRIARSAENDWYLSLIAEETNPPNIRAAAIAALGYAPENTARLMELYKTEKGRCKTAAITALARLNAPEAEPLLEKLTAKSKGTYSDVIAFSGGAACTVFVRNKIQESLQLLQKQDETWTEWTAFFEQISMLSNKPATDDCYLQIAAQLKNMPRYAESVLRQMNRTLILNLREHAEPEFREMILRLYVKDCAHFFIARLFLELKEHPEHAFLQFADEINQNRMDTLYLTQNIYYDMLHQSYCLAWGAGNENACRLPVLPIAKRLPESILAFLTDTSYIEPIARQQSFPGQLLQVIQPGQKHLTQLEQASILAEYSCMILCNLLSECAAEDFSLLKEKASTFALYAAKYSPNQRAIDLLIKFQRKDLSDYYGLAANYMQYCLCVKKSICHVGFVNDFPISEEAKIAEIQSLRTQLQGMKSKIGQKLYEHQMRLLDLFLQTKM